MTDKKQLFDNDLNDLDPELTAKIRKEIGDALKEVLSKHTDIDFDDMATLTLEAAMLALEDYEENKKQN